MQNVLFIITKSEVGGAQKFVKEQIDITVEHFNVFLCTNKAGWLTDVLKDKTKLNLLDGGIEKLTSIRFLLRLYLFIKKNKISLVVTNSANAGFYGRIAAFFAGVSSCYLTHGWSSVYNGGRLAVLFNFIEKILSKFCNKVICVSDNDYQVAVEKVKISPSKLVTVKNAIFPICNNSNINLEINNKNFRLIALARFAKPKRIDLMIEAVSLLPEVSLDIAGSGSDFKYWSEYLQEKNINNVHLLGEVPAFDNFIAYDAFLLISDSEGLPISAIEAMSVGLPLVLSNVGGCAELIYNNGTLVDNNIKSITDGIKLVVNKTNYFSNNSIDVFNQNFNLNNVKMKYIDLYKKMVSK
jgi:glycosyltransferase involved in cell wall biosynthesis